jgi:hypothetical protein
MYPGTGYVYCLFSVIRWNGHSAKVSTTIGRDRWFY